MLLEANGAFVVDAPSVENDPKTVSEGTRPADRPLLVRYPVGRLMAGGPNSTRTIETVPVYRTVWPRNDRLAATV